MYYLNRRFKNDCICPDPNELPCNDPPPQKPCCTLEIKCSPCGDRPPEIRFEIKI